MKNQYLRALKYGNVPALNNIDSVTGSICSLFRISDNIKNSKKNLIPTILPPKMCVFMESVPGSKDRPA